jgi:hypothetical protein
MLFNEMAGVKNKKKRVCGQNVECQVVQVAVTGRLRTQQPTARGGSSSISQRLHENSFPTGTDIHQAVCETSFLRSELKCSNPSYVLNLNAATTPTPLPQQATGHVYLKSIHQDPRLQVPAARDLEEFSAPSIFQYHLNDHGHNLLKDNEPLTYKTHCIKRRLARYPNTKTHMWGNKLSLTTTLDGQLT